MTAANKASLDVFKDIPGYKAILKAVLKNQIQMLVEQLSDQTGDETVILTASVSDGTLSHLGSEFGNFFLEDHEEIKSQFLGYCLTGLHKRKAQDNLNIPQAKKRFADEARQSPSDLSAHSSESDMVYSPSQTYTSFASPSIHPVAITKAKQKSKHHSSLKQNNRDMSHSKRHEIDQSEREFGHQVETGFDMGVRTSDDSDVLHPSLKGTDPVNIKTEPDMSKDDDFNENEEQSGEKTTEVMTDSLEKDKYTNSATAQVKVEMTEEDELEITGIEPGDTSNQIPDFGQSSSDSQLYIQNMAGMIAQNTSLDSPQFDGEEQVRWTDEFTNVYLDPVTKLFGCGSCEYKSPIKTNVRRHTRVHKSNQADRPVCSMCDLSFIDNYKLKKHMEADHMGIRYTCQKCGRTFKSQYVLNTHKRCHAKFS